jgi:hypothetical protein
LIAPPSLVGKGAGGLGLALTFPHDVKSQVVETLHATSLQNLFGAASHRIGMRRWVILMADHIHIAIV